MLTLNLKALGVTEAALTNAILSELGCTREEAVRGLAAKLGVDLTPPTPTRVQNGDVIETVEGQTKAAILTPEEQAVLAKAGAILNGKLNG